MIPAWELEKREAPAWIDAMGADLRIIGPAVRHGEEVFVQLSRGAEAALDYGNTLSPPKEFFLPHSETMFSFTSRRSGFDIIAPPEEERGTVLFGVRPCDVNALLILDHVFTGNQDDSYYVKRRESTILVALACHQPLERCFCGSVGAGPSLQRGFDVLLTEVGDTYLVEVATDKGRALLDKAPKLFREASEEAVKEKQRIAAEAEKLAASPLSPTEVARRMQARFDDGKWADLGERCLQCGGCTYCCPTCWCFDVFDRGESGKGDRLRCWDCCLLPGFTRMAGGANPRRTREARMKQRFYHKWDYFVQRFGKLQCVGCGRCTETALCHIDWKQVFDWATGE